MLFVLMCHLLPYIPKIADNVMSCRCLLFGVCLLLNRVAFLLFNDAICKVYRINSIANAANRVVILYI